MNNNRQDNPWGQKDRTLDPAYFLSVHVQLERARQVMEERFLFAGDALVETFEMVQVLIRAFDRIAGSLDETNANRTIAQLHGAISDLHVRIETEKERGKEIAAISRQSAEIESSIGKIRETLRYLNACASATRIAGAGSDKFMSFADDIASYVRNAEHEVASFSSHVGQIGRHLGDAGEDQQNALTVVGTAAPKASEQIVVAAEAIERRRVELERLAVRAAPLMHAVGAKFTNVLSALQIGDMTRQRIEHVQAHIQALLTLMESEPDKAGLCAPVLRLLDGLTSSLAAEFDGGASKILGSLQGVARDARNILALSRNLQGSSQSGGGAKITIAKDSVDVMRAVLVEVEAASRQSASVDEAVGRLVSEMLGDMSKIGNLRNVRQDIKLLAINAYLHCSRMGELGRSVGAIATEINLEGDKLGRSVGTILQVLSAIGTRYEGREDPKDRRDLVADLDGAAAALQTADRESEESLDLILSQGESIAERIGSIVQGLDFSRELGEKLSECSASLSQALADSDAVQTWPEILQEFSTNAYAIYTMKSERDVHLKIFPDALSAAERESEQNQNAVDLVGEEEDFFL
jgi:hypothetical protein